MGVSGNFVKRCFGSTLQGICGGLTLTLGAGDGRVDGIDARRCAFRKRRTWTENTISHTVRWETADTVRCAGTAGPSGINAVEIPVAYAQHAALLVYPTVPGPGKSDDVRPMPAMRAGDSESEIVARLKPACRYGFRRCCYRKVMFKEILP